MWLILDFYWMALVEVLADQLWSYSQCPRLFSVAVTEY